MRGNDTDVDRQTEKTTQSDNTEKNNKNFRYSSKASKTY